MRKAPGVGTANKPATAAAIIRDAMTFHPHLSFQVISTTPVDDGLRRRREEKEFRRIENRSNPNNVSGIFDVVTKNTTMNNAGRDKTTVRTRHAVSFIDCTLQSPPHERPATTH